MTNQKQAINTQALIEQLDAGYQLPFSAPNWKEALDLYRALLEWLDREDGNRNVACFCPKKLATLTADIYDPEKTDEVIKTLERAKLISVIHLSTTQPKSISISDSEEVIVGLRGLSSLPKTTYAHRVRRNEMPSGEIIGLGKEGRAKLEELSPNALAVYEEMLNEPDLDIFTLYGWLCRKFYDRRLSGQSIEDAIAELREAKLIHPYGDDDWMVTAD